MFEIPTVGVDEYLAILKPYQRDQIAAALGAGTDADLEKIAREWLSAVGPTNTITFGGEPRPQAFFDVFMAELKALLCGTSDAYKTERAEIEKQLKMGKSKQTLLGVLMSYVAGAIAIKIGVTAALLFPVVGLLIVLISKMGIRAWCAAQGCPIQ